MDHGELQSKQEREPGVKDLLSSIEAELGIFPELNNHFSDINNSIFSKKEVDGMAKEQALKNEKVSEPDIKTRLRNILRNVERERRKLSENLDYLQRQL